MNLREVEDTIVFPALCPWETITSLVLSLAETLVGIASSTMMAAVTSWSCSGCSGRLSLLRVYFSIRITWNYWLHARQIACCSYISTILVGLRLLQVGRWSTAKICREDSARPSQLWQLENPHMLQTCKPTPDRNVLKITLFAALRCCWSGAPSMHATRPSNRCRASRRKNVAPLFSWLSAGDSWRVWSSFLIRTGQVCNVLLPLNTKKSLTKHWIEYRCHLCGLQMQSSKPMYPTSTTLVIQ